MASTLTAANERAAVRSRAAGAGVSGARGSRGRIGSAGRTTSSPGSRARGASRGPRGVAAPTVTASAELAERLLVDAGSQATPRGLDRGEVVRTAGNVPAPAVVVPVAAVDSAPIPATQAAPVARRAVRASGQVQLTERGLLLVVSFFAVLAAVAVAVVAVGFFSVSNAPLPDRGAGAGTMVAAGGGLHQG